MKIAKQLAIFLENRPGALARVCDALTKKHIHIFAITTSDTIDHTVARLVVSDSRQALLLFEEHGTLVVEDDVLLLDFDNKLASITEVCQRLAKASINIEYCYCTTSPTARKGLLVLRVDNPNKALKILSPE